MKRRLALGEGDEEEDASGAAGVSQEPQLEQPSPQLDLVLNSVAILVWSKPRRVRKYTICWRHAAGRYLLQKCSSAATTITATATCCIACAPIILSSGK